MARKKEFDKDEVLAKAMMTFWRYGYEGTSMQNLVESMGINRGSLYDTFGDKRSLFLEAIAYYQNTVIKQMLAALKAEDASKQTIVNLFQNLVTKAVEQNHYFGCLITNTAIELCPHDAQTQRRVDTNFHNVTNAFKQALSKAQAKGEIAKDCNITSIAQYFTSSLQGLQVITKVNRDRKTLNSIVSVILSVLD